MVVRGRPAAEGAPFARLVLALLFCSGAVALVYQSLWTRQLSLILGSTTYATGTVLAAFMAGLGVGARALGRLADRSGRPLCLYAGLELATGLLGLASPLLLAQGNGLYALCYAGLHGQPALLTLARFLIGFLLVAAPAFLMGGTLPVMARHIVRRPEQFGRGVGLLYAVNTLGAALGTLLVPFLLLPALGVCGTLLAGGAINVLIALVAWMAGRRTPVLDPASPSADGHWRAPPRSASSDLSRAFFLSSFVALALETVWNRFFVLYFGSSIYAYASILVVYLTGIALGGVLFTRLDRRGHAPGRVFAVCLVLLVVDLAVTIPLMDRILYLQLTLLDWLGLSFAAFHSANVVAAVLVILPPTILFGTSFPAAVAAGRGVAGPGAELGRLYLVNTAGTTAGALAASFLLIPLAGVRGSLDLLAVLAAAALALAARGHERTAPRWRGRTALVAGLAFLPTMLPGWDARLMHARVSSAPTFALEAWRERWLRLWLNGINVRELREGVDATVSVAQLRPPHYALLVNGKIDAGDAGDMFTQVMLGHLPMTLHPAPRDVLVIGMGSGTTLAAVARHPATAIDLVEISPEVLELGDRYFRAINRGVLFDRRVGVHVEDGRNFVAFDRTRTYDVIVSEPSNPWMTGVANLFTDEFFAHARRRLRAGGILAQWFHYYSMELDDIRSLVGTLHRHFAYVYGFAFSREEAWTGDLLLVASVTPIDFTRAAAAFRGVGPAAEDLQQIGIAGEDDLAGGLVLSPENIDRFVAGAPVNSDDRPRIELHAPRALFDDTGPANLAALAEASIGARLAVRPRKGASRTAYRTRSFEAVPPDGYQLAFSGYRIGAWMLDGAGGTTRELFRELAFEAPSGSRIRILSARGTLDRAGLDRLAGMAAEAPLAADGETAVNGHVAITYRLPAPGAGAIAWTCPETQTSHTVVISGGGYDHGAGATPLPGGIHCRHR